MRLRSSEYRRCGNRPSTPAELLTAALLLSIIGVGLGPTPSTAQETEVAYVEDVSGRVIATTQGKPTLLDALDLIGDRTRLDLQASSEARICHHVTQRLFELKGPLRAAVSREGVTVESGKAAPAGSCARSRGLDLSWRRRAAERGRQDDRGAAATGHQGRRSQHPAHPAHRPLGWRAAEGSGHLRPRYGAADPR